MVSCGAHKEQDAGHALSRLFMQQVQSLRKAAQATPNTPAGYQQSLPARQQEQYSANICVQRQNQELLNRNAVPACIQCKTAGVTS